MPLAVAAVAAGILVLAAVLLLARREPAKTAVPATEPTAPAARPAEAVPTVLPTAPPTAEPTEVPTPLPTELPAAEPTALPRRPTAAPASRLPAATAPPPSNFPQRPARYPPEALEAAPLDLAPEIAAKHRGQSVGLIVTVAEDGTVKKATVISEVCPECDRAAVEAVRKYRFRPARDADGRPVEATIAIPIRL